MSDFKTRLETEEGSNPTRLESSGDANKTRLETGGPSVRGAGLRKDDVFGGYRIIERLRVASLEADLYVVERVDAPQRFTLKLYRPEFRPRADILSKVHSLRREHIVEIIETGTVDESFFEIQEYVQHGSLADMLRDGALSEAKAKEALKEIATALAHLHEVDVLHRDIKPSNILVRTKEPQLDLVLTDFGLSRETDLSFVQASRLGGTAAYSAPEASTKGLVKKSDWWSIGIILIEMLTGRHPFSGITDLAISVHVATKPVAIPESFSTDWKLIIKGLLTRDPEKRWGFQQIAEWLNGKRDIPVYFDSEIAEAAKLHSYRPYRLSGHDYYEPADLGTALAKNWEEAVKRVGRLHILNWVKEELRDDDMTNALQDVADDSNLNSSHKLAVALIILNPQLPVLWEDAVVDLAWMRSNSKIAVEMLDSSTPLWLRKLRNESWMEDLNQRRRQIWRTLQSDQVVNRELAEQLILGPPEVARAAAKSIQDAVFSSRNPLVNQLLGKSNLDDGEAILLAACDRSLLWTKAQESIRRAEEERTAKEAAIAERERQRRLQEQETAGRVRRRRESLFELGNVLGWIALAVWLGGISGLASPAMPVQLAGLVLAGVSIYFALDYRLRESNTRLRAGHKIAIAITVIVGALIAISLSRSAIGYTNAGSFIAPNNQTPPPAPHTVPRSFSGLWTGAVRTEQATSGRVGTMWNVRLQVNEASRSAQMWMNNDSRTVVLSIVNRNGDELQMRGRLPATVGRGTETIIMELPPPSTQLVSPASTQVREDNDNGGWAIARGLLFKQK